MTRNKTKKTLILLLSLLLIGTLTACAPSTKPDNTTSSEPIEPPAPDDTLYSGTLHVVDEETLSGVQVHHVADDASNPPQTDPYEVVDIGSLDSYHEYEDAYADLPDLTDISPRIIFTADTTVKNFRYLVIETLLEDSLAIKAVDTLHRLDELTPDKPFVVNWVSIGDVGMYRGISFTDEDGTTRYFGFNISGRDGDVYLIEFKPE